jgi:hypothetical protein
MNLDSQRSRASRVTPCEPTVKLVQYANPHDDRVPMIAIGLGIQLFQALLTLLLTG